MRSMCFVLIIAAVMMAPTSLWAVQRQQQGYFVPTVQSVYKPATSLIESLDDWTRRDGMPITGWEIVDGYLHCNKSAGDMYTVKQYGDFALDFSWTIKKGGNSGIKYKYARYEAGGWVGCEYQILDDPNTGEGKMVKHEAGSLYDIAAPAVSPSPLNPTGEANTGRVVVRGDKIQHYLNGVKVVDIRVGSPDWKERLAVSKFSAISDFGAIEKGHIMVQDHGGEVWLHNLDIREIVQETFWSFVPTYEAKKCGLRTVRATPRRLYPTTRVVRGR